MPCKDCSPWGVRAISVLCDVFHTQDIKYFTKNNFKLKRNGRFLRLTLKRENDSLAQREEVGCIQIKQYKLKNNVLSSGVGREHWRGQNCRSRVRRQKKSVEIRSDRILFLIFVKSFKENQIILNWLQ